MVSRNEQSTAVYIVSVDSEHSMRSEFVPDGEPRTLTAAYIEHAVDVQVLRIAGSTRRADRSAPAFR